MILWAIFNLVVAIMILAGDTELGVLLAWSIIIGWIVTILIGIVKGFRS